MELRDANKILQTVKSSFAADGYKIPSAVETDGLLLLLEKIECDKYLAPKIKHLRASAKNPSAYKRENINIMFIRALEAVRDGITAASTVSLMLLNKDICGDTQDNAGKLRTEECLTNGCAHTDPKYISGSLKSIIQKMNDIPPAPATAKDDFATLLTHYMRELLIMHPFDCECPLTLRLFMVMFCKVKGFTLGFHRIPPSTIKKAEDDAFFGDDVTPLYKIFSSCLSYEHTSTAPKQKQRTKREANNKLDSRPSRTTDDTVKAAAIDDMRLKRVLKLQQKISKLTEQLTELTADRTENK